MIVLDNRLATIASFVRRGSLAADVGCDHAYLSIWLVKNNIARHVIASDISDGPLYRAQKNIAAESAGDRITLRRCDGLEGIDHFNPDDIIIAGMGGEQIVDILEAAPFTRTPGKRLILQPMTRPERLRSALVRMGYVIRDEALASDDGWIYQVICAESRGHADESGYNPLTQGEFLLGRRIIERGGELFLKYLARQIDIVASRYTAKRNAGYECEGERQLLLELVSYQKRKAHPT